MRCSRNNCILSGDETGGCRGTEGPRGGEAVEVESKDEAEVEEDSVGCGGFCGGDCEIDWEVDGEVDWEAGCEEEESVVWAMFALLVDVANPGGARLCELGDTSSDFGSPT